MRPRALDQAYIHRVADKEGSRKHTGIKRAGAVRPRRPYPHGSVAYISPSTTCIHHAEYSDVPVKTLVLRCGLCKHLHQGSAGAATAAAALATIRAVIINAIVRT